MAGREQYINDSQKVYALGRRISAVVTSNSTTYVGNNEILGIYVGGTGTVVIEDPDGTSATFSAIPVGSLILGPFTKVTTASTATLMVKYQGNA